MFRIIYFFLQFFYIIQICAEEMFYSKEIWDSKYVIGSRM